MLPACFAVFPQALDARTYTAGGKPSLEEMLSRLEAKQLWVQLIHWIAAHGRLQWMPGTVSRELLGMDERISGLLPHMRYRGPVFYLLHFACAIFSLSLHLRSALVPVAVSPETLARKLIIEIEEFLGPDFADILTDLLLATIQEASDEEGQFERMWVTLDLQGFSWIPQRRFSCIRSPKRGAKGLLWNTYPEEWLMRPHDNDPGQEDDEEVEEEEEEEGTRGSGDHRMDITEREDQGNSKATAEEENEEGRMDVEEGMVDGRDREVQDGGEQEQHDEGNVDVGAGVAQTGDDTAREKDEMCLDEEEQQQVVVKPKGRRGRGKKVEVVVGRHVQTRSRTTAAEQSGAVAGSTSTPKRAHFADEPWKMPGYVPNNRMTATGKRRGEESPRGSSSKRARKTR